MKFFTLFTLPHLYISKDLKLNLNTKLYLNKGILLHSLQLFKSCSSLRKKENQCYPQIRSFMCKICKEDYVSSI